MAVGSFIDSFLNDCDIIEDTKNIEIRIIEIKTFFTRK